MNRLTRILTLAASITALTANSWAQTTDDGQGMLELPFFDDFSYIATTPADSLWERHGATLSHDLPSSPPSTGALLLDALDSGLKFYPNARYGSATPADTIESLPIDLEYPGDKSIWMSFFYQRGGLGDSPEAGDSLVLEFYSVPERKWQWIKSYKGGKTAPFEQEMINITEDRFLQKGFRFRFRNYISLGSSLAPDLVSNCDHWLIDYITIDKNRHQGDTVYNDVSLTNTPIIKVGDYQEVPWRHYVDSKHEDLNYIIHYRNNDNRARLLDSINLYLDHDGIHEKYALGTFNMPSYMDFENRNEKFMYEFTSANDTAAQYDVTVKLVSDAATSDFAANNIVTVRKTFHNCYALDDGTAEAAYGLHGEGSDGAMIAIKFHTYIPDKIHGVYMYFCPVYRNMQADNFDLKVWSCQDGIPQSEIYTKPNVEVPKDSTGKFVYIPLDTPVEVRDTFFIGWQKNETSIIAVGFDRNTTTPNHKYFNIGGDWRLSKEPGQIMIRPSFGDIKTAISDIYPSTRTASAKPRMKVYPNPATTFINVEYDTDFDKPSPIMIINARTGQIIRTIRDIEIPAIIDVGDIPAGAYIISSPATGASAKLLITK